MAHLTTISGTYRDGVIELSERPAGVSPGTRVLVTFLDEASIGPEEREALRQEALADMRRGIELGGPPYPKRAERVAPVSGQSACHNQWSDVGQPPSAVPARWTAEGGCPTSEERTPGFDETPQSERPATDARRDAGDRLIQSMKEGIPFGGAPYPSRDELYQRHKRVQEG